jgi:ABC-type antimicrobial peptide transport system permease subunit
MLQDCRLALRTFRGNPLLTATVIACLALGIGVTTAVFSVVDGVLLRTLPYPDADRLVVLRTVDREDSLGRGRVSEAELRDWQTRALSRRRFTMRLLSMFSAAGVFLAIVGIVGIVAYSLSLRIREVGIRVAIGASPRSVILLMSRQGLVPVLVGLMAGLFLAVSLNRFLGQMLYAVSPFDPAVFGLAAAAVASASVLAAVASAYRACRIDPATL